MGDQGEVVLTTADYVGGDKINFRDISNSIAAVGRGASVIVNQALSLAEEARQQKELDRQELALAVAEQGERLRKRVSAAPSKEFNPYKNLLPFSVADAARFYGRQDDCGVLLERMTRADSSGRLAILQGDAGFGKSSMIRAGVIPGLVANEHLPLIVQVTTSPLATTIKRSLLPDLTPNLETSSLRGFFRQVVSILGPGKRVFVLLDQFERFFDASELIRQQFVTELASCLSDEDPYSRWLISIRSSCLGYLNTFQPDVAQPFANMTVLGPLSRSQASLAIMEPAKLAELEIERDLSESVLDDLGEDAIEPARLQIVCHTLVKGLPAGEKRLTMEQYVQAGRAGGILRDYLDTVLKNNIPGPDRENAWRVLETVEDLGQEGATAEQVISRLNTAGIDREESARLLVLLEENRLVRLSDEGYWLTSDKFAPRIRQWSAEQAVIEQARQETIRQLERVRDSALRGLVAGAIGFSLAFLITFAGQINETNLLIYITLVRTVPGGLAGLLLILFVDIGLTSYRYRRQTMIWVVGGLAGAASFALAFWFQAMLRSLNGDPTLPAALEGALWGAICGLGIVWVVTAHRFLWIKVLAVIMTCGLVLWLIEPIASVFGRPDTAILLFLAGAVLASFLVVTALLSSGTRKRWTS